MIIVATPEKLDDELIKKILYLVHLRKIAAPAPLRSRP
jgi:hypothetical protein